MKLFFILLSVTFSFIANAEQNVYFINLKDGDKLESPIFIQFGLSGMGVAPAGTNREGTGHHHLLINVDDIDISRPIPSSSNHIHFGGGQTETTIDLPSGVYTLQLLLGNMSHIPHNPPVVSEKIKIEVIN
jgi:hypothetical protein|tara:strand:+ start:62 stop:454 length:393 start_codon:yes stop_codon:yes gene_type:complete